MEDLSYTARQERLASAFRDLDREGRLTPALYGKILEHPSGRMFVPDLHEALARSGPERAAKIFGSLLTAPPDLPHQSQLEIRRGSARALSQVTESSEDEKLYVGAAPGWLVRDGLGLLAAGNHGPAYPVMRQVALDVEEELVTRTAALKAMARLYPPDKRQDLAEVARELLAATEGELEQPEVEAVIEALDER